MGISISKKVEKSAVKRNYERRVIKEIFRNHPNEMLDRDYLIIKNRNPAPDFKERERDLLTILSRIARKEA